LSRSEATGGSIDGFGLPPGLAHAVYGFGLPPGPAHGS